MEFLLELALIANLKVLLFLFSLLDILTFGSLVVFLVLLLGDLLLLELKIVVFHALANLSCLLARVADFLLRPALFLLQHPHAILQLQHVLFYLETDAPGLRISQVFGLEIDDDL